jgi:hypothetical protein
MLALFAVNKIGQMSIKLLKTIISYLKVFYPKMSKVYNSLVL